MLSIEEYIARRKREDKIDEFDINARNENMRVCVNYTFEYFNNYLNITEAEERTVLKNEKLDKYRQQLSEYDGEIVEWLVGVFSEYGKYVDKQIGNILKKDEFFFLYNSDKEFRELSYHCYANLIKKLPFIRDKTEMIFQFIKEYHRVQSQQNWGESGIFISEEIDDWTQGTWAKYQINLWRFVHEWLMYFSDNEDLWTATHRKKIQGSYGERYYYDYKQKSNLFNIDSLYRRMPKKSYIKGRKQEFEVIMMYYWLHQIEGDNDNYWQEYLAKTLPSLKKL